MVCKIFFCSDFPDNPERLNQREFRQLQSVILNGRKCKIQEKIYKVFDLVQKRTKIQKEVYKFLYF